MAESIEERIVEKLAVNEETIGRLYESFAEKFPEHRDFWNKLAGQEKRHAQWVRRLHERIGKEKEFGRVLVDRFSLEMIERSIEGIKHVAQEAKDADFTFEEALKIAMEIENTLLEKRYFEIFEGEQAEINQVLELLGKETTDHVEQIRRLIK